MSAPDLLALGGALLVISLVGPSMSLFRRAAPARSAASAAMPVRFRYKGAEGQTRALLYAELPDALGRWAYTTQTTPSFFFAFDVVPVGRIVRIYIVQQPGYGDRPADAHTTHRIPDGGRHYICVNPENPPVNGREAATYIVYWSEATARYLLTGARFS